MIIMPSTPRLSTPGALDDEFARRRSSSGVEAAITDRDDGFKQSHLRPFGTC